MNSRELQFEKDEWTISNISVLVSYLVLFESEVTQNKMIDFKFFLEKRFVTSGPLREFSRGQWVLGG